jgi:single-strand DNA-binding protein
MSNLNNCIFQGNLTADPELVGSERNVCRFSVAVTNGFGEYENTMYIRCVAFGKQGAAIAEHFQKGKPIIVSGTLVQNNWENDEGQKFSRHELKLRPMEGFNFVGNNRRDEVPNESSEPQEAATPSGASNDGEAGELF